MARYLANTNTKEIHDLEANISSDKRALCELDKIKPEHKKDVYTEGEVDLLIKNEGYDGCKHCLPEYHTD